MSDRRGGIRDDAMPVAQVPDVCPASGSGDGQFPPGAFGGGGSKAASPQPLEARSSAGVA